MRIIALVLKRLTWFVPTLVGLLLIVFCVSHIIPANPAVVLAGEGATQAQIDAIKEKFGLDQPLPVQFWRYLKSVVSGDLGTSIYTQRPISEDLITRVPATLELTLITIVIAALLGIPLGVIAAARRNSFIDHALRFFTVSGLAIASFWLAILFQLLFAMKLGWTPLQGRADGWGPDPVTGFFLIDAIIQGDWAIFSDVARPPDPARHDAGLSRHGHHRALHPRRRSRCHQLQLRALRAGHGSAAARDRLEVRAAQRAHRHGDADRPDLRHPAGRRRRRRDVFSTGRGSASTRSNSILRSDYNGDHGLHAHHGRRSSSSSTCSSTSCTASSILAGQADACKPPFSCCGAWPETAQRSVGASLIVGLILVALLAPDPRHASGRRGGIAPGRASPRPERRALARHRPHGQRHLQPPAVRRAHHHRHRADRGRRLAC